MTILRSRITPIPLRRVTRRNPLTAFTRGELNTERAAWLVFGIGVGALVVLFLTGCGSAVDAPAEFTEPEVVAEPEPAPVCVLDGLYNVSQISLGGCAPSQTFQAVQKDRVVDCAKCEPGSPSLWCEFESTLGAECEVHVTWELVQP